MSPTPGRPIPEVSILMVTYGGYELARRALSAVVEHTPVPFEVVVVDNASPDGAGERLRRELDGATVVLNDRNVGFGPGVNQAAALARGRYLVLLNSDALVRPGWLEPLVETIEVVPAAGAVVSCLLNEDGTVQEAGSILWADGSTLALGAGAAPEDPVHRFRHTVDYGSAACMLIRRSTFLDLGGLDPAYLPAYCEDVDLALRLRQRGLRTVYEPRSEVLHVRFGSSDESAAARLIERNREVLRARWKDVLAGHLPPADDDHPHRLVAARDAHVPDRLLVVAARPPRDLLRRLARALPEALITSLSTLEAAPPDAARELADAGIEVSAPPAEPEVWFRARLFHFAAVVVVGAPPPRIAGAIDDTQPQAPAIPVPGDDAGSAHGLVERLAGVGVASPGAAARW